MPNGLKHSVARRMGNMIASMNQVAKTEKGSPQNRGSSPNIIISPNKQKRGLSSFV